MPQRGMGVRVGVRVGGRVGARCYARAHVHPLGWYPLSSSLCPTPHQPLIRTRLRNKAGVARVLTKQEEEHSREAEAITTNVYRPPLELLLKT